MSKRQAIKRLPSVEYLLACFDYDPSTGVLTWNKRPQKHFSTLKSWATTNARLAGTVAGGVNQDGYLRVRINDGRFMVHRICWKMSTGEDPHSEIDHKDGNPANNRLENLRVVTRTQQVWNSGPRKDNTSGRRGVQPDGRGKWKVEIGELYVGRFTTIREASHAYETAARNQRGEFYRGR
jgi:hypothetical protein